MFMHLLYNFDFQVNYNNTVVINILSSLLISDFEKSSASAFFKSTLMSVHRLLNYYECYTGIGFRILHPVIAEAFSVRIDFLQRYGSVLITLQDAEELIDSVLVRNHFCVEENGYCKTKLSAPLLLPKGFEGELRVHKQGHDEELLCSESLFTIQPAKKWVCICCICSVLHLTWTLTIPS